jgi:hypothetical protein
MKTAFHTNRSTSTLPYLSFKKSKFPGLKSKKKDLKVKISRFSLKNFSLGRHYFIITQFSLLLNI